MNKKVERIKKPLLIPLCIVLLLLLGSAMIGMYKVQRQNLTESMVVELEGVDKLFNSMLREDAVLINSIIDFYSQKTLLQKAFLAGDREMLLQESTPLFQKIKSKYNITHFYFYMPDRINFLRVHNPPRYGDYIARITMNRAVHGEKNVYGIELGPYGTFTLRVVQPWHVNGELIGYLELGKEIEHITPKLKNIFSIDLLFTINKSILNREKWEEGLKMMKRSGNWEAYKQNVVIDKTLKSIPKEINDIVNRTPALQEIQIITLPQKNQKLISGQLRLKDASGKIVGDIILLKDVTSEINASKLYLQLLSVLGLILGIVLFGFFYKLIDRLENDLITERKTTEKQYAELERLTSTLKTTNRKVVDINNRLNTAYNEVSTLIGKVIAEEDFGIRYQNLNLVACYEIKNCNKTECQCYGTPAQRCWQVAGTYCGGEIQGQFAQKYANCYECEVFKKASLSDPVLMIGEEFNNMMHLLEVKNVELKKANNELKNTQSQMLQREKMASIGQLAAGVAHEINNPMGFITSNLGTLQKYVDKFIEYIDIQTEVLASLQAEDQVQEAKKKLKLDFIFEDTNDLLQESLAGVKRVTEIVQNLKSFSHVDEEKILQTDINECIENTLKILSNELKYKATVHKDYGNIPPTFCNAQGLNQVFMNILVNAGHAIETKGDITIQTSEEDGKIKVVITDTGSGIPEDTLEHIFEPFFTTKEIGKGTGLGLSICYDIVKKHEGMITVDSKVGKGTTFIISMPVK